MESVKITSFEAENVKRVKAVQFSPAADGLTIIGGRNDQGKTTILDSIAWTLGGERFRPSSAVRDGSVTPPMTRIVLSNGLVVQRSGKNGSLKVTDPSGKQAGQQLLNTFVEQLALNLPKFMSSGDGEKAATLLRVIGLEDQIRELDRQEKELYSQRHAIGQIADQKKKYAKELPSFADAPKEPVSALELIQKQQEILYRNGENQRKRERAAQMEQRRQDLARRLSELEEEYAAVCQDCETAQKNALDLLDESTDELEQSLFDIETINKKVAANQEKARAEMEAKTYFEQYERLAQQLESIRAERIALLDKAPLPLPGLSVENGKLTYQGKSWDCMSGSGQLKVATAIVRALNPACGFVLLDKLEQMDLDTLRAFGAWMEAEGLQGIATRVSTGGECSIIIEDGRELAPPEIDWGKVGF